MLKSKLYSQLNARQSKLLEIAIDLTNSSLLMDSTSHISQIGDYQLWRDRDNVAIVNTKTQKPIVFGSVEFEFYPRQTTTRDLASQSLWKNMQQHFPNLNLDISAQEVFSSFEFLKSLNPAFKNLNQIETVEPKDYSLNLPKNLLKHLKS